MQRLATVVFTASCAFSLLLASQSKADLVLQLQAQNYNASTGLWTATVGPNASRNSTLYRPGLALDATPSGEPAVTFDSSVPQSLILSSSLGGPAFTTSPSFTIFVVAQSSGPGQDNAKQFITGDSDNAAGYRLTGPQNLQNLSDLNVSDVGTSATGVDSTNFHIFDVTYGDDAYTFRADEVTTGFGSSNVTFAKPLTRIGNNSDAYIAGNSQPFDGEIAELRVYNTALSSTQVAAIEDSLYATYETPTPEPSGLLVACLAFIPLAARRHRKTVGTPEHSKSA